MVSKIGKGRIANSKFVSECPLCGCKFSFEESDIIEDKDAEIQMVKCPDCGRTIVVLKGKVAL